MNLNVNNQIITYLNMKNNILIIFSLRKNKSFSGYKIGQVVWIIFAFSYSFTTNSMTFFIKSLSITSSITINIIKSIIYTLMLFNRLIHLFLLRFLLYLLFLLCCLYWFLLLSSLCCCCCRFCICCSKLGCILSSISCWIC